MVATECPKCGATNNVADVPPEGLMTKCAKCRVAYIAKPPVEVKPAAVRQIGGLTVQPLSRGASTGGARKIEASDEAAPRTLGRSLREEKIAERLRPFRDKTYYEILRAAPGSTEEQLRRAHAYLMQKEAPAKTDPGFQAWKDLLDEAFHALSDKKLAAKYARHVADSEMSVKARAQRKKLEVDPKVDRMMRAIAANVLGEASFLNEWARSLDPEREDLSADAAFIKYRTAPAGERAEHAQHARRLIEPMADRWGADVRLKLYLVMLVSATEGPKKAKALMSKVAAEGHPLYEMAIKTLSSRL